MRTIKGLRIKDIYERDKEINCKVNIVLETNFFVQVGKTNYTAGEAIRFFMWLVANKRFDIDKMLELMIKNEPGAAEQLRYVLNTSRTRATILG